MVVVYAAMSWVIVGQALVAEVTAYEQQPEELGLTYEEASFSPRDEGDITLKGWWFLAESSTATVVWIHGLDKNQASRLPLVADLMGLGYSVLTLDLRGHGESDKAAMGGAIREQRDVLGAVDYLLAEELAEEGGIFLVGESYGAAVALLTGYQEPAVAGVFADSAFASMSDLITKEVADRTVLPGWAARVLRPGMIWMARAAKGLNINDAAPLKFIEEYPYPLGFAVCRADERIPFEHTWSMRALAAGDSDLIAFPSCGHADGYDEFPDRFVGAVGEYIDRRLEG